MTTFRRWIDATSDAEPEERALLEAGLDANPPPAAEAEVWRRLSLVLVPPPGAPGPGAPVPEAGISGALAGKGVSTLATLGKGFLLGVGVSLVVAGGARMAEHPARLEASGSGEARRVPAAPAGASPRTEAFAGSVREPTALDAAPSSVPPPNPREVTLPPPSSPAVVESQQAVAAPPAVPGAASMAGFPPLDPGPISNPSQLREEALLLKQARERLRAGDFARAYSILESSRRAFSAPELYQEREALNIELLHQSGQRPLAAERARIFLARFPESPHASKVAQFAK